MAGTGFHHEGHKTEPVTETRKIYGRDVISPAYSAGYRFICASCAEVARTEDGFSDECIDDC